MEDRYSNCKMCEQHADRIAALEAALAIKEAECERLRSHIELLAGAVLEYPEFDCDCETEPRPLCAIARAAIDADRKEGA